MPEKSVREMSRIEKKHYSLSARVFHSTVIHSVIMGIVAILIGQGLFIYSLGKQYIAEGFSLSNSAVTIINKVADIEPLAEEVMNAYRSGSTDYISQLSAIPESDAYNMIADVLQTLSNKSDLQALYVAMYDEETSSLVYIVDPDTDPDTHLQPGEWETVSIKGLRKFLNWDGTGMLFDIGHPDKYGWMCTSGVPFYNANGEKIAFVLADISLNNMRAGVSTFFFQLVAGMFILTIVISLIMASANKKGVAAPIDQIAEAATRYISDKKAGLTSSDHFSMLNIKTGDEIENLSLILADMEQDLSEYEDNLAAVTAERERVSMELSMATQIQTSMLPGIYPAFPDRAEFDIYATMNPAREVGGDFYDFFMIDDDHMCIVMADVSGKGIPGALMMMVSKIIIANNAKLIRSPADILYNTNATLCVNNKMQMFVTAWVGILEISTGTLTAANAGHEYPVIMQPGGMYELVRDRHGLVLGGLEGSVYSEYELQLIPGSRMFLYTDGIPEATDSQGRMFGIDRMLIELNRFRDDPPVELLGHMKETVDRFVNDAEQFDDLTMLCLEYNKRLEN